MNLSLPYSHRGRHVSPIENAKPLITTNVGVKYPSQSKFAINNISLDIQKGNCVALVGPNGSGKSTFLKAIAGLLPLDSGEILVYGHKPKTCHHRTSYLSQRCEIDWSFPISVYRLVLSGCYVHLGWFFRPTKRHFNLADQLLIRLGLQDLSKRLIRELSGGQQQRVLIARALMQEADLLLLDEPFNAIDSESKKIIKKIIEELRSLGKTFIIATHEASSLEKEFDYALYFNNGIAIRKKYNDECAVERILLWNH